MNVHVLAVATPERGPGLDRGRPVPEARPGAGDIGLRAEAVVFRTAVLAGAAGDVLLEGDAVAFLHMPLRHGLVADACDKADILMAEDFRPGAETLAAVDVAAADAAGFDLEKGGIVRDVRELELA